MFLLISDPHMGLTRKSGVTADSLRLFEAMKATALESTMFEHQDKEVVITGDLFNGSLVSQEAVLRVSQILRTHPKKIWVIAGNHDLSNDKAKMSSLEFLHYLLEGDNVEVVFKPTVLPTDSGTKIVMVPHLSNQELFNAAIASVDADILITHCNYENPFAVDKDHSLNLTKEQAKKFKLVISGHEHNASKRGNVCMLGAFAPCAVNEAATPKQTFILDGASMRLRTLPNQAQDELCSYGEVDWRQVENAPNREFINVIGEATTEEAPTVLNAIANARRKSSASMIKNSVTVESISLGSLEEASFESVDTWEILEKMLAPKHKEHLRRLGYGIN